MSEEIPLPSSIESEQAILGAILIDPRAPEAFDFVSDSMRGDEFFLVKHKTIYDAMCELRELNEPVDFITLTARLQDKNQLDIIGSVSYLAELANSTPTAANVMFYVKNVKDKADQRFFIIQARVNLRKAERADGTAEAIADMQNLTQRIADRSVKKVEFTPIYTALVDCFSTMEKQYYTKAVNGITGLPSGYTDLDKMTAGFQKSDLIIVGARPSVGKTAFALNIAQNIGIKTAETVAIFSLEMGIQQLIMRMICAEANVDANKIRTGLLEPNDWEKITVGISALSHANIYIDDSPALTVNEIRAKCRRLKKEKGLGLILIDYLQLIAGNGKLENRQQEISYISRTLKQIARELEVPVIALSQLSRGVEQRQDKRPMMSDLRESGSIEQDADIVAFLYRDDYYNKESEKQGIIEIIIAKQRNGPVGSVELAFLKNYNKFVNLDRTHVEQTKPPNSTNYDKNNYKKRWG
ncbi:replicative DNA helicase [Paenibacillus psychroresistens]|uniref:Replicative DNA helicase n=2 Tax=Paenibacillus psychroresistens TaxID=1778678 RepID=A0A6B8RUH8_9BACL|nr:replicative DNA helicase [Paenibacillus psychroresistens]QGR00082.1 replicative DNA helicase [Paenibacillus psychroresistens]